jgi:trypsin
MSYAKLKSILIICVCFTSTQCQNTINRIPPRQQAKYDKNGNLEWFPAIVGGVPAVNGEFPSHLSIQTKKGMHLCGGALIDVDYVLTPAHCISDEGGQILLAADLQVMGDDLTIIKVSNPGRQVRKVLHIFRHPMYNHWEATNDIAVLKVEKFKETNSLSVAPYAYESPITGDQCHLAGWGVTKEGAREPNPMLFKARLNVTDFNNCNASYSGQLKPNVFCVKGMGIDACQGDSGGAMVCNKKITGIVSFGNGCDKPSYPGVYTDVSKYESWIDEVFRTMVSDKDENTGKTTDGKGSASTNTTSMLLTTITILYIILKFSSHF